MIGFQLNVSIIVLYGSIAEVGLERWKRNYYSTC